MQERQKAPRTNHSKRTLPAAFNSRDREPRHVLVQLGPQDAGDLLPGVVREPPRSRLPTEWDEELSPAAEQPGPRDFGEHLREVIRLDELVFLSSCPQRHGQFVMKKMFHPPSLALFCLIEVPGSDQQRARLKALLQDWLRRWCALQAQHPDHFVAVPQAFWDAPQGYPMAILCEYMPLGSLEDLIQACGGLPEEAIREVAQTVLEALNTLHGAKPPVVHGCLKPSQVLFSSAGRPRLTFGLEQLIKGCQVWPSSDWAGGAGGPGELLGVRAATPDGEQLPQVDIFDLGVLLLVSALGGIDVLLDAIPFAREFGSSQACKRPHAQAHAGVVPDTCSFLIRELRGAEAQPESLHNRDADTSILPPAADLLFNRQYSQPFLDFVSICLEAHNNHGTVTAADLLQHEFLRSQALAGPLVTLREMQGLARLLNEAPEYDPSIYRPAKTGRSAVPGVAPSVAQSAQLYLVNIAQAIAPHCRSGGAVHPAPGRGGIPRYRSSSDIESVRSLYHWHPQEWETLLVDTARTLGLSQTVVQNLLEAQLERLVHGASKRPVAAEGRDDWGDGALVT